MANPLPASAWAQTTGSAPPEPSAADALAGMDPWMVMVLAVLAGLVAFLFWGRYTRRGGGL